MFSFKCFVISQFLAKNLKLKTKHFYFLISYSIFLFSLIGCSTNKPKVEITLPPAERYFSNVLHAGKSQASFQIPMQCSAYSILTINYSVQGRDTFAAVEANAFENFDKSMAQGATNSALPYRLKINIRYLGSIPFTGYGKQIFESKPRWRKNFSSHKAYYHCFQIINIGNCILKSQGYGMVSYRIRIIDSKDNFTDLGDNHMQLLERDLYPEDSTALYCLVDPLPVGNYTLQIMANIHNESVIDEQDSGPVIEETDLPIQVLNEENPLPGLLIPSQQEISPVPIFPRTFYHWEEYLQALQVHAMDNTRIRGQLLLQMGDHSQYITVKLITELGNSNAAWQIKVNPNPYLGKIDSKTWRKSLFKDSKGYPSLITTYSPTISSRFTLNLDSTLYRDLTEMKNLGIQVLELEMNPQDETNNYPLLTTLTYCKDLGIKIIPSIHLKESANLSQWLDKLYKSWNGIFYHTGNGLVPVNFHTTDSFTMGDNRKFFNQLSYITGFQNELKQKYKDISTLNSQWNSSFKGFTEIQPDNPVFHEWTPALLDWDSYRSEIQMKHLGEITRIIQKNHSNFMFGYSSPAIYGIESTYGEHYYAFYNFNWLGARKGILPDSLFNKTLSRLDFLTYLNIGKDTDIPKIVDYAKTRNVTPLMLFDYCGSRFIQGLETHPVWKDTGGWEGLPGINGRDYRTRMALYPQLKSATENGAVPGIHAWYDPMSFSRISDIQKQEIRFFNQALRNK